jgi:hypothetical protein
VEQAMTVLKNLMIDIETLGTRPNAPVTTIGACFFDPLTGEIGKEFYRKIDMADSMRFGTADPDTIKWWLKQDSAAQLELVKGKDLLADVLRDFSSFYNKGQDTAVWGNGPTFDITILEYAYAKCLGEKAPWPFWNVRDVRTVVQLAEGLVSKPAAFTKGGVAHNALDDCYFQISYVSKMWQALRPAKTPPAVSNIDDDDLTI